MKRQQIHFHLLFILGRRYGKGLAKEKAKAILADFDKSIADGMEPIQAISLSSEKYLDFEDREKLLRLLGLT